MTLRLAAGRVSVIVPVRDGERYLKAALASVFAQTSAPAEVIVVDDGSRDASAAVAEEFPGVTCLRQAPQGQGAALNAGVAASSGELLSFLDADDEWVPRKLELQLAALVNEPDLEGVFGHAEQFRDGAQQSETSVQPARLPSALLIQREAFERVGPFATDLRLGMVVEWYGRARLARLRERMLDEVVYRRRIHETNLGVRLAAERAEYAVSLKRFLDRKRAGGG